MPVKIFVWKHNRQGRWGHTSLKIDEANYVSWWPQKEGRNYWVNSKKHPKWAGLLKKLAGTDNIYKVKHDTSASYAVDVQKERGHATTTVTIADGVLNKQKMTAWWHLYNKESASYHTIKKNCSVTVIRALRAGGSDQYVPQTLRDSNTSKYDGWEPPHILNYLREMQRTLAPKKVGTLAPKKVEFSDDEQLEEIQSVSEVTGGGVEMCTAHGFPLLECPHC